MGLQISKFYWLWFMTPPNAFLRYPSCSFCTSTVRVLETVPSFDRVPVIGTAVTAKVSKVLDVHHRRRYGVRWYHNDHITVSWSQHNDRQTRLERLRRFSIISRRIIQRRTPNTYCDGVVSIKPWSHENNDLRYLLSAFNFLRFHWPMGAPLWRC